MVSIRRARTARRARRVAAGLTVIEALLAAAVLLVCVLGVSMTLGASATQVQTLQTTVTCGILGQELLEEITSKPFPIAGVTTNPGWDQGQHNRAQYDDVGDYDGYTDSTPLKMLDGTAIDSTPPITYTRSVTFSYMSSPSGPTAPSGPFGLVTVTVTPSVGAPVTFVRVVSAASVTW